MKIIHGELLHCIDGSLAVSGSVHASGIYAEGGTSRMATTAGIVAIGDDLIPRLGNDSFILLLHLRHTGAVRIMELMCIGIQNIGLFCRRIRCCGLAGTRNSLVLLAGLVLLARACISQSIDIGIPFCLKGYLFPVADSRDGTLQVGPAGFHIGIAESGQDILGRMSVGVVCTDGNDGILRVDGAKEQVGG